VKGHFSGLKAKLKNKLQHSKQRIMSSCDIHTFYTCIYCGNVKISYKKENVFVIDTSSLFGGSLRQTTLDQIIAKVSSHNTLSSPSSLMKNSVHKNVTPISGIYIKHEGGISYIKTSYLTEILFLLYQCWSIYVKGR
jgi:hypothetical protein